MLLQRSIFCKRCLRVVHDGSPTIDTATAAPTLPSVFVRTPPDAWVMARRTRRAVDPLPPVNLQEEWMVLGRRGRNSPFVDPSEMAELPTAQRQRMNTDGDYYTRQQDEEEHTTARWHRGDDHRFWGYRNLERQRNTAMQQAEWHQHPLWRMCGPCLAEYDSPFWIWNRCCARCATFLRTSHAVELVTPAYQREREGGHELEESRSFQTMALRMRFQKQRYQCQKMMMHRRDLRIVIGW
eukprot:3017799-Amphidinium_carterae.1